MDLQAVIQWDPIVQLLSLKSVRLKQSAMW